MTELESLTEDDLPVEFGRYTLTGLLGQGGMGRVFRAELRGPSGFRKQLALKVIARRTGQDVDKLNEEFFREARFSGLLKHENVVDVYDFGIEAGHPWLAMELLSGRPLDRVLREGPLPPQAALDLGMQLCSGLTHAHGLVLDGRPIELVHRDLKPGNIIVTPRGVAKILDFGLARSSGASSDLTAEGTVRGTPTYMAPEQARTEELDARTDLFALGLVLYEAVTGKCLLARDNIMAVMMALIQLESTLQEPEVIGPVESAVPGLGSVLTKLLKQDPDERYSRAAEVEVDLRLLRHTLQPGPDLRVVMSGEQPIATSGSVVAPLLQETLLPVMVVPGTQSTRPSQALARRTNLAADSADLIGRAADLSAIADAENAGHRLITLLGPGGTGKTRLARRYAMGRMSELLPQGGVWFCDLSEATTTEGIYRVAGLTLGVPLDQGESPAEVIGNALADRGRMLMVLDNVEQIVTQTEAVVEGWLRRAPGLQLLVTSRERLRLPSEQVVELGPLAVEEAVDLFVTRAKSVSRRFVMKEADTPVIEEIVRRLDCLPLAIELAAARVSVMAPRKILERLDQRFRLLTGGRRSEAGRLSTLRGAIQWSWDLLDPAEQDAFAQCSVFRGGFTLEAAEEVVDIDAHEDAPWTLDVVQALRDKSLLFSRTPQGLGGEVRFGMYESLREFASEQLAKQDGPKVEQRHARTMVRIGAEFAEALEREEGKSARIHLALELDNLHAAYERTRTVDSETAIGAALVLIPALEVWGPTALYARVLEEVVEVARATHDGRISDLLVWRARHHRNQGRREACLKNTAAAYAEAEALGDRRGQALARSEESLMHSSSGTPEDGIPPGEEALRIARSLDDDHVLTTALYALSMAIGYCGRKDESLELAEEALALSRKTGNLRHTARALLSMAVDRANAGDVVGAEPLFRECLVAFRRVGARNGEAMSQGNLGLVALQHGRLAEAQRRLRKALDIQVAHGNRTAGATMMVSLGCVALMQGDFESGMRLLRKADERLTQSGHLFYLSISRCDRAIGALLMGLTDEAEEAARAAVDAAKKTTSGTFTPTAEAVLSAVLACRGTLTEADELLRGADAALKATGDPDHQSMASLARAFLDLAHARRLEHEDPPAAAELRASARIRWERWGDAEDSVGSDSGRHSTVQLFRLALEKWLES